MRNWIGRIALLLLPVPAFAQLVGTAFTYQGTLEVSNAPANGSYDLRFDVYDSAGGPTPIAGSTPILIDNLAISSGVFTVQLDFGNAVFIGGPVFVEVSVREAAAGGPGDFTGFTSLSPRQPITPAPYAMHAESVPFNSIGSDQIGDDSISSSDVDATQIQIRSATMATNCAADGLAIKTIATNGAVTCDSGPTVSPPLSKSGNDISLPDAANYARKDSAAGNQSFDLQNAGSATLHLDYDNDRVGVLDTTPSTELDINGTASANDFVLRSSTSGRLNITGGAFIPASSNAATYIQAVDGHGYIGGSSGGTVVLMAPFTLPPGSIPNQLNCFWYDNDADSSFTSIAYEWRMRQPLDVSSTVVVDHSTATSGASTSMNGVFGSFTGAPVALSDFHYLRVVLQVGANNSSSLRFYGCNVGYSYTTLRN
jgi:hypothetical protein